MVRTSFACVTDAIQRFILDCATKVLACFFERTEFFSLKFFVAKPNQQVVANLAYHTVRQRQHYDFLGTFAWERTRPPKPMDSVRITAFLLMLGRFPPAMSQPQL